MEIVCVEAGLIQTNCYIIINDNKNIINDNNNEAIIVDTALDSADLLFDIINERKLRIKGIVLTHSHWDHSGDANELRKLTGAPVLVHKEDEYRLLKPNENTIMQLPIEIEECVPDRYLNNAEIVNLNGIDFEVRHTPGHTEGSICLINHADRIVFAGDTIFSQSVGRTDLPGGSTELLLKSIREQLMTLDDDYTLYCGHGPSTNVGVERRENPFINGSSNYFGY